jgi:hypothetical protein
MKLLYVLLAFFITFLLIIVFNGSPLPYIIKETFATLSSQSTVTESSVAPLCPPGFRFFTDRDGKSMCCSGKIDFTEGRCTPKRNKSRLAHMCALGGDTLDEYGTPIQFCGSMIQSLLAELAARDCTNNKPYRATADGISGFCCSAAPSSARPDQCPKDANMCNVISEDINPFTQSASCSFQKIEQQTHCPKDMYKTSMVNKSNEMDGLTVPLCMTTTMPISKTTPMCIPSNVLNELRKHGVYRDKDLRKWIGGCELYRKVNIDKTETAERADLSGF